MEEEFDDDIGFTKTDNDDVCWKSLMMTMFVGSLMMTLFVGRV